MSSEEWLDTVKRRHCERMLGRTGSIHQAAKRMRIGRATLYRWLDKWRQEDDVELRQAAPRCGVAPAELQVALGRLRQKDAMPLLGIDNSGAMSRRMAEVLRLLRRRRTRFGLALAEDHADPLWRPDDDRDYMHRHPYDG